MMDKINQLLTTWEDEKKKEQELVSWMRDNKEHLIYYVDFKDIGYAFVEDVIFTDQRTDEEVYRGRFMGMGEAEEFADSIFV